MDVAIEAQLNDQIFAFTREIFTSTFNMPLATSQPALSFTPLHPTFGASVEGMKWEAPVPQHVIAEILDGVHKYGVLVFRKANLDNEQHIEF